MSTTAFFALAIGAIFVTNLLPAFGPPTWALLVFFKFNGDLPVVPLVIAGAVASTSGRYLLARGSNHFQHRFSDERVEHLADAKAALMRHRSAAFGGLALFMLSPLPSAQMFVAAGLLGVPLIPLSFAFLLGRLVSYSLYLGGASLAYENLGDTFTSSFTSTPGILAQLALVAAVVAMVELDWAKWVTNPPWRHSPTEPDVPPNDSGRPEGRPPEQAA